MATSVTALRDSSSWHPTLASGTSLARRRRSRASRGAGTGPPGEGVLVPATAPATASPPHGILWQEKQGAKLLALVKRMALRMRDHLPAHVDVNDLVGAGVLGLLDALRKFDASKQVKLESYARHRIRGAMLDGLRSLDGASRDLRRQAKRLEKLHYELTASLGRPVTGEEMAAALGMSLSKWYRTVRELQLAGGDPALTGLPFGGANPAAVPEEALLISREEDAFERCYHREQKEILLRARARLPERERVLLQLYYDQGMTMKQIGERLGIEESRVSQLHSAAVARLRTRVKAMLCPPPPAARVAMAKQPAAL